MLNDFSYNLFCKKKVSKTDGGYGFRDVYIRFLSRYSLMADPMESSKDQEDYAKGICSHLSYSHWL